MKQILTFFAIIAILFTVQAQTTRTMNFGGTDREYLEYVPASYDASTPAPVLFVLHGLGDDMSNMFNATGFRAIANQHGWIVVTPQALNATVALMGQSMDIGTAWNSGVSANLLGNNIIINDGVDDSGFMMAILDELIANYNVDQNNVFVTGFSMGGFMANRLAIEHADRIRAIASVSGTIGNEVKTATPAANVSAMHIHGTADAMVGYENADFSVSIISVSVGLGAEATVEYWRNFNQCTSSPTVTNYPDNVNDSLTFERYEYTGGTNDTKTVFIKVIGGDHDWYYTPANDIDYTTEIYNFFVSCQGPAAISENENNVSIYPNPANSMLHINGDNISEVRLLNALGQQVFSSNQNTLNISQLSEGIYIANVIFDNGKSYNQKVIISR